MGVLFDYFAAPSDERAAEIIDLGGGPAEANIPVVQTTGIDPVVQMGTLESLLTGVDYDTVADGPRSGHIVAVRDEGERFVGTITDELQAALAEASPERLDEVVLPWSQTEEFEEDEEEADPKALAQFLAELGQLARTASANGDRIYCWVCV